MSIEYPEKMKTENHDKMPHLIVMLTHNDYTAKNASEIFEECKNSDALFWGMKEKGISHEEMKHLFSRMKEYGKTTFLEIVGYTETEGLKGAELALECGCDYVMGAKFFPSISKYCKENNIKYLPFVGQPTGRPSVLNGTIEEIVEETKKVVNDGAFGVDLLGYRFTGNPVELNKKVVEETGVPVCIAGSIDNYDRLDEVKKIMPWSFTIGSAFFNNKFGASFCEQINKVIAYINQN